MSTFVELSHVLGQGMPAYPGLPDPRFEPIVDHEASRDRYDGRAEFYLGRVDIPCNSGTYLDSPFHRYRDGRDLSQIELSAVAGLHGLVVDGQPDSDRKIVIERDAGDVSGRAVLVRTGWDERWGTDAYWEPGPWLAHATLRTLIDGRAALVGVDFWNVDNVEDPARPAHTELLKAGILIVEHMCNLNALPASGFRFFAPVLRIAEGGSFPVRAFAEL
jgi:arylformamidase